MTTQPCTSDDDTQGGPHPAPGLDGWFWASDAPAEGARIEMRHRDDGGMDVRTSDASDKVLTFTRAEWVAWLDGVEHHEFDHLATEGAVAPDTSHASGGIGPRACC